MGLIKAALGATGGVLADQWKEYFYCEAIPSDVLAVKGRKKATGRSSNKHGDDNIITNGSVIAIADGQCMLIVEQGKVVDVCAEPGEYTYDMSTEPSIFSGDLGDGVKDVFANIGKRFTFGGEAPKDQRIYYFNTKELTGNKYGTPSPVPFRVVDQRAGIDLDIGIRCFGEYSIRLKNPLLFYTNVCGNVSEDYKTENIAGQMKTELLTALQPAFAKISEMGIRYSALPGHTLELADALNEQLSGKWRDLRGMEIVSFGVSSVKANEEDEQMIKELQRNAAFMDPTRAAAHLSHNACGSIARFANDALALGFCVGKRAFGCLLVGGDRLEVLLLVVFRVLCEKLGCGDLASQHLTLHISCRQSIFDLVEEAIDLLGVVAAEGHGEFLAVYILRQKYVFSHIISVLIFTARQTYRLTASLILDFLVSPSSL